MREPEFEEIGGVRFSTYRSGVQKPGLGFTWFFPVAIFTMASLLLCGAAWSIQEMERGNPLATQLFAGVFLTLLIASYAAAILISYHRRTLIDVSAPTVATAGCLPVLVTLYRAGKAFARSVGTMEAFEDRLIFSGEQFDFQLRTSDFRGKLKTDLLVSGRPVRLLSPKGTESISLSVAPYEANLRMSEALRAHRPKLESMVERWQRAAILNVPSVYPPIVKPLSAAPPYSKRRVFIGVGLTSLGFGCIGILTIALFGRFLPHLKGHELPLMLAVLPWTFILMLWADRKDRETRVKKFMKLKSVSKVEMS